MTDPYTGQGLLPLFKITTDSNQPHLIRKLKFDKIEDASEDKQAVLVFTPVYFWEDGTKYTAPGFDPPKVTLNASYMTPVYTDQEGHSFGEYWLNESGQVQNIDPSSTDWPTGAWGEYAALRYLIREGLLEIIDMIVQALVFKYNITPTYILS